MLNNQLQYVKPKLPARKGGKSNGDRLPLLMMADEKGAKPMAIHEIIESLEKVISSNDLLRNAYLWRSPSKASSRRELEKSYTVPRFEFKYDGKTYSVSFNVSCSCAHVYVYRDYRRDGDKVDIRVLKNVYNKMYVKYIEGVEW